jgi:hypothetical protein
MRLHAAMLSRLGQKHQSQNLKYLGIVTAMDAARCASRGLGLAAVPVGVAWGPISTGSAAQRGDPTQEFGPLTLNLSTLDTEKPPPDPYRRKELGRFDSFYCEDATSPSVACTIGAEGTVELRARDGALSPMPSIRLHGISRTWSGAGAFAGLGVTVENEEYLAKVLGSNRQALATLVAWAVADDGRQSAPETRHFWLVATAFQEGAGRASGPRPRGERGEAGRIADRSRR